MRIFKVSLLAVIIGLLFIATPVEAKPLSERVNEAFRHVFDRNPVPVENNYWLGRVVKGDKTTFPALVSAMAYHRSHGRTMGGEAVLLSQRVNEAFRSVYGRNPLSLENRYWLVRVLNGDKTTFESLRGAMLHHKGQGRTIGDDPAMSNDEPESLKKVVRPLFFSIFDSRPNQTEKDWWRKRIDCEELVTHHGLTMSMRFHFNRGARIGSPNICKTVLTPLPQVEDQDIPEDEGTLPVETF